MSPANNAQEQQDEEEEDVNMLVVEEGLDYQKEIVGPLANALKATSGLASIVPPTSPLRIAHPSSQPNSHIIHLPYHNHHLLRALASKLDMLILLHSSHDSASLVFSQASEEPNTFGEDQVSPRHQSLPDSLPSATPHHGGRPNGHIRGCPLQNRLEDGQRGQWEEEFVQQEADVRDDIHAIGATLSQITDSLQEIPQVIYRQTCVLDRIDKSCQDMSRRHNDTIAIYGEESARHLGHGDCGGHVETVSKSCFVVNTWKGPNTPSCTTPNLSTSTTSCTSTLPRYTFTASSPHATLHSHVPPSQSYLPHVQASSTPVQASPPPAQASTTPVQALPPHVQVPSPPVQAPPHLYRLIDHTHPTTAAAQ
ncbi:uncharacterized protein [Pleurodeles waltl]|uniref:uncharacterized protein n=1 Tax=Pleurodeles waltl TaxID=8319 RepID=UPI00370937AD